MKATITEVVAYDDVKIETYLDGDGPTLVIIPSYGRDGGKDYDVFTQEIVKAGFKVIRPQPRGIAGSTGPMDGITLHDLAADVVAAIRRLGDGSAIVLGHAYGNFIARMIATDAPEVVRGASWSHRKRTRSGPRSTTRRRSCLTFRRQRRRAQKP